MAASLGTDQFFPTKSFPAAWLKPKKNKSKPNTGTHTMFRGLCRFGTHLFCGGLRRHFSRLQNPRFCLSSVTPRLRPPPVFHNNKTHDFVGAPGALQKLKHGYSFPYLLALGVLSHFSSNKTHEETQ